MSSRGAGLFPVFCGRSRRAWHHGSVRVLSWTASREPAPRTFRSPRNKRVCTTPFSGGDGKVLKHGWPTIAHSRHGGCRYAQSDFQNRHNRNGVRCCSVSCVVAFRYAVAGDHCPIVDQSNRDGSNLQGSATSGAVGRHLTFLSPLPLPSSSSLDLAPVPCRGFLCLGEYVKLKTLGRFPPAFRLGSAHDPLFF